MVIQDRARYLAAGALNGTLQAVDEIQGINDSGPGRRLRFDFFTRINWNGQLR